MPLPMLSPKEILILETAVGDLHLDRNNGLIWAVVHPLFTNESCFWCTQFVSSTRLLVQDHGTWPVPNPLSFTNVGFRPEWSLQSTVSYTQTCFVPLFCCSVLSPTLNTVTAYQCIANIFQRSEMTSHLLGSSPWQWLHQWPHFLHS